MGFIGKIIGGIFAFLGGIFKSAGKIVGLGKSDYYMEAAPLPAGASAQAEPAKLASAKAEPVKAPAKVEEPKAEAKAATAVETAPAKTDLAPASLETVKAAIAEAPANGAAANAKKNGKKARKAEAEKLPAPVKAAEATPKTDQTFAPNYLIQTSGSRRRPGPSLDPFRNLAKQVKS
jgi:hypothetical protein